MRNTETRSPFDVNHQKSKLNAIGVYLKDVEKKAYIDGQFSTTLVYNFRDKPLKHDEKATLLGFEELDEFLSLDEVGLVRFFIKRSSVKDAAKRMRIKVRS